MLYRRTYKTSYINNQSINNLINQIQTCSRLEKATAWSSEWKALKRAVFTLFNRDIKVALSVRTLGSSRVTSTLWC